jgi:hypothetical protein
LILITKTFQATVVEIVPKSKNVSINQVSNLHLATLSATVPGWADFVGPMWRTYVRVEKISSSILRQSKMQGLAQAHTGVGAAMYI